MMKETTISALIDLMSDMITEQKNINDAISTISFSFLDSFIERIVDIIIDDFDIPKDNTLEMIERYGEPEGFFQENTFCRDFVKDWFFEFEDGTISKEQLIYNLLNWNKIEIK